MQTATIPSGIPAKKVEVHYWCYPCQIYYKTNMLSVLFLQNSTVQLVRIVSFVQQWFRNKQHIDLVAVRVMTIESKVTVAEFL